jgi:hypothetical protein
MIGAKLRFIPALEKDSRRAIKILEDLLGDKDYPESTKDLARDLIFTLEAVGIKLGKLFRKTKGEI